MRNQHLTFEKDGKVCCNFCKQEVTHALVGCGNPECSEGKNNREWVGEHLEKVNKSLRKMNLKISKPEEIFEFLDKYSAEYFSSEFKDTDYNYVYKTPCFASFMGAEPVASDTWCISKEEPAKTDKGYDAKGAKSIRHFFDYKFIIEINETIPWENSVIKRPEKDNAPKTN